MASIPSKTIITDWDDVWRRIKPMGKWQWIAVLQLATPPLFGIYILLMQMFIGTNFEHHCQLPAALLDNFTVDQSKQLSIPKGESCAMYDIDYESLAGTGSFDEALEQLNGLGEMPTRPCDEWYFNKSSQAYQSSIQEDFSLVCDRAILLPTVQSLVMVGFSFGVLFWGVISDRFGRRPVLLIAAVGGIVGGVVIAYATSYNMFVISRVAHQFVIISTSNVGYTLAMEVSGSASARSIAGNFIWLPGTVSVIALAVSAYYVQQWRNLVLVQTIAGAVLLIYFFLLPESPLWLAANGRLDSARRTLRKAAKTNGRTEHFPADADISALGANAKGEKSEGRLHDVIQLFGTPRLFVRTCVIIILWIVNAGVYYGIAFYAVNLGGNIYVNVALGGLVEIPAYLLSMLIYARFARRWPLALLFAACSACCFGVAFIDANDQMDAYPVTVIVLATAGRFFISVSFSMTYLYSAELYPTVLRAAGMGVSSFLGRSGSIGAPYIQYYGDLYWSPLTQMVFGACSLAACFLTMSLPETRNIALAQTIEDAERLGKSDNSITMKLLPAPAVTVKKANTQYL